MTRRTRFWIDQGFAACFLASMATIGFGQVPPSVAQPPGMISPITTEMGVVNEAAIVLQELTVGTVERIPEHLLSDAFAIAIIPHAMRGAFIIGMGGGRGVLVSKDRSGRWQGPEFITFAGGSVGWQIGVQAIDLVIIFRTPRSLEGIRNGRLTLGATASVAAGPVGRYASAETDTAFQAEILTYSRSRGLFAGVSLQGSTIQLDVPATQSFYQITPTSAGVMPRVAEALVSEINRFSNVPNRSPMSVANGTTSDRLTVNDPQIQQLANEVVQLQRNVDVRWKEYLGLPADWVSGRPILLADIQSVLLRYERVETNPQFQALNSAPEFQKVLSHLRALSTNLGTQHPPLNLPPPPADLR